MTDKNPKYDHIPQIEVESLARLLLPEMRAFLESEQGKQEFEKWKKEVHS